MLVVPDRRRTARPIAVSSCLASRWNVSSHVGLVPKIYEPIVNRMRIIRMRYNRGGTAVTLPQVSKAEVRVPACLALPDGPD